MLCLQHPAATLQATCMVRPINSPADHDNMQTLLFDRPWRHVPAWLAAIWCLLAMLLAWLGTLPDQYLIQVRGITAPQPYPYTAIGIEMLLSALVFTALGWACAEISWRRVGKMALSLLLATSVGVLAALGTMHMPAHFVYFALSMLALLLLSLLAFACCAVAGCMRLISIRKSRRAAGS